MVLPAAFAYVGQLAAAAGQGQAQPEAEAGPRGGLRVAKRDAPVRDLLRRLLGA